MNPRLWPARSCAGRASALSCAGIPVLLIVFCSSLLNTTVTATAAPAARRPQQARRAPDRLLQSPTDNYVAGMEFMESWQSKRMPLKVYFHPSDEVPGYDARYVDEFKTACDEWAKATENRICFQIVEQQTDSDIEVNWTTELTPDLSHTNAIGATWPKVIPGEGIDHAKISMLTTFDKRHLGLKAMRWASMHELGHALGLGHSVRRADVMYKTVLIPNTKPGDMSEVVPENPNVSLTARDGTTMNVVYAAKKIIDGVRAKGLDLRNTCHELCRASANCITNGDSGSAIIVLNEILRLDSSYSPASDNLMAAYYNCGAALYNNGNYGEARKVLERAMTLGKKVGDRNALTAIVSVYRNCQQRD